MSGGEFHPEGWSKTLGAPVYVGKRSYWIDYDGTGAVVLWSDHAYLGQTGWCNVTPVCRYQSLPEAVRDEVWQLITRDAEDRISARTPAAATPSSAATVKARGVAPLTGGDTTQPETQR